MSELEDHGHFTTPTSSSTPYKSRPQQHPRSSSTDSRLSTMPLDAGLYKFQWPCWFLQRWSHSHVQCCWGLTSPPATQTLNVEQSTEIFNPAAECQALSTYLAKQFQKLSGLEVMHHAMAQATAHKTINVRRMAWEAVYSALCVDQPQDKKHEETMQQLCAEADKVWKDANDLVLQHKVPTFLHSQNSRILYKIPGIIFFFFFNVASTYNWVSVYTLYVLLLHCFVYTTQKYAYLPLQPPIMTCITLKGGS